MAELAEILETARGWGYEPFDATLDIEPVRVNDVIFVDSGTDPGDDATVYLLETGSGARRYLLVSDSFHADPRTARLIDQMTAEPRNLMP